MTNKTNPEVNGTLQVWADDVDVCSLVGYLEVYDWNDEDVYLRGTLMSDGSDVDPDMVGRHITVRIDRKMVNQDFLDNVSK